MQDDIALLREFVRERSAPAFAELVRRNLPAVYAVALRKVGGDGALAQDVAQQVFVALARKSAALAQRNSIVGWLFVAARLEAADAARREGRRRERLQEIQAMIDRGHAGVDDPDWEIIRRELDEIIHGLRVRDREAVLLRFFHKKTYVEIATVLHISENGARMRVDRAVERMRTMLARRGITSGAALLASALSAQSTVAIPSGLSAAVAGAAMAVPTASSAVLLWLASFRLEIGLTAAIVTVVAIGGSQLRGNYEVARKIVALQGEAAGLARLREEYVEAQSAKSKAEAALLAAQRQGQAIEAETAPVLTARRKPIDTLEEALQAGPLVDEASLAQPLQPVDQTSPKYPPDMIKLKVSGTVIVSLIVTVDGGVIEPRVKSSTRPEFEESALQGVSLWLFTPPALRGVPVNVRTEVPVEFKLHSGK